MIKYNLKKNSRLHEHMTIVLSSYSLLPSQAFVQACPVLHVLHLPSAKFPPQYPPTYSDSIVQNTCVIISLILAYMSFSLARSE